MPSLSIVIPIAPGETQWEFLLKDLADTNAEIILSGSNCAPDITLEGPIRDKNIRIIQTCSGRAEQLNAGAKAASGTYIWFLHADSRVSQHSLDVLNNTIQSAPESLFFFNLQFSEEGGFLMPLNQWGANIRSKVLGIPFGDQGFLINKTIFNQLGGYPEGLPYGEDHVFVWRAKQNNIAVKPIAAPLITSSRKYQSKGWLKTTLIHQYLWLKQAWPEYRKWKRK